MPARLRAFTNGQRETMELQSWQGRGDEKKMMKRQQSHEIRRRSGDEEPTCPPRIRSKNIHSPKSRGIWQPGKLHIVYLSAIMSMTVMICWRDVAAQHEVSVRCQTDG